MRIIGYARLSTREQSENSLALEQQIARLKAAGATEIFQDIDSGSKDKRAQFIELMELVRRDEIQEVIVTRIDRLTRKLKTMLEIRDVFLNSSVNLRALDDSIDLSTPAGKFHLSLLGSLAEMEVDRLGERIKHGWEHMRKNQRVAVAPFGYKVNDGKLELNDELLLCLLETRETLTYTDIARDTIDLFFQAKTLRGCIRLFNEKYGIRRFNNGRGRPTWWKLGWSHTGLSTWITSPVLLGHTYYPNKRGKASNKSNWDIYYDTHPALITIDESYEISKILENNRQVRGFGTNKRRHPTAGLVYCGECRAKCYSVAGTRGKTPGYNYYFQCKNWRSRSCNQKKTIRVEKVEEAIIEALTSKSKQLAEKTDKVRNPTPNSDSEILKLKKQLKDLEAMAFNPAIEQAKREISRQIQSLEKQDSIEQSQVNNKYELLESVFSMHVFWKELSNEDLTRIYHELVDKVTVLEGNIKEIKLKF